MLNSDMSRQSKFESRLKNRLGFSMIELMVTVAIIGVLASLGIFSYSRFQAKSRQTEAKLALAALFTAEESFRQEWNQFSVDLKNIGYSTQGAKLRYVTGFTAGTGCAGYTNLAGAPIENNSSDYTWNDGSAVNTVLASWPVGVPSKPTWLVSSCTQTAFMAISYGNPSTKISNPGAVVGDTWTVNQSRLLSNIQINISL